MHHPRRGIDEDDAFPVHLERGFMLILLLLPCLALVLVSAGFLYQWLGARHDRKRYAGEGRFVDIGEGCRLYLFEKGSGGPTVLFESGIAATNLNWSHIQETVAQFTHTASYDRAGLGWSSRANSARTPGNIAVELHAMLQRAGIQPPYVLVGHSFGGLVMRRFALLYPAEVAGVVLIDPMRPEEWPPLDPGKQATVDRGTRMASYGVPIARLGLARLAVTSLLCRSGRLSGFLAGAAGDGGRHVLDRIKGEVCKMPREVWPSVAAHWSRPAFYVGMSGHVRSIPETVREMHNAYPIRGIPVLLFTPATSSPLSENSLRGIGDNVEQILAVDSSHWVHLDEPTLVIDAIREMVRSAVSEPVAVSR
jgi:pimeloyl-ACP methyl ester carboxylesterase